MKLNFINEAGNQIVLNIELSANIRDMRRMLFKLTEKVEHIELEGKIIPLTDNKLIHEYQISEQSNLKLIPISKKMIQTLLEENPQFLDNNSDMHPSNDLSLSIEFDTFDMPYKFEIQSKNVHKPNPLCMFSPKKLAREDLHESAHNKESELSIV
jgi:hypothetical protein